MRALLHAALAVTALGVLGQAVRWTRSPGKPASTDAETPVSAQSLRSLCPPGTLPDHGVCIPVPRTSVGPADATSVLGPGGAPRAGTDFIPRRPDRPADYQRYRWPVPLQAGGIATDVGEGSAGEPPAVGLIRLEQAPGSEVRLVALDQQQGDAEAWFVGELAGPTVVTLHRTLEAGVERRYLLVHRGLGATAPELGAGASLPEGTVLGFVGPADATGLAALELGVRLVRTETDLATLAPADALAAAHTTACDPRNVLPLVE